jgi:hypothetical protein
MLSPHPEAVEETQKVLRRRLGLLKRKLCLGYQVEFWREVLPNPLLVVSPLLMLDGTGEVCCLLC